MAKCCVSVIVPVYKVPEKYLRKCIESIQNQTMRNIEILLVDDGSPNNCGEICDEYALNDERIIVIHKENGGLSSARNAGQRAATGEYIMFVDGDDWIEKEMCEELYSIAYEKGVELVMCGMYRDYASSSAQYEIGLENLKIYEGAECKLLQAKLLDYNCGIAVAYSKLILKSILDENNIFHDEMLRQGAEGLEFNIRLFDKIGKATFINKSFYHYIYNDSSISSVSTEENNQYVLKCFQSILKYIKSSENERLLISWFYNRLLYVIVTTAVSGYFNPDNKESYKERVNGFNNYLKNQIVQDALKNNNRQGISKQRKMVLWMIKYKFYFGIELLGQIRRWQKKHK